MIQRRPHLLRTSFHYRNLVTSLNHAEQTWQRLHAKGNRTACELQIRVIEGLYQLVMHKDNKIHPIHQSTKLKQRIRKRLDEILNTD